MVSRPADEARAPVGADAAHRRRWGFCYRQFDLVRAKDGETYLTRWWLIDSPLGGIALHRMTAPDARPTIHDHPFSFLSLVLRGGYTEDRLNTRTMEVVKGRHVHRWNRVRPFDAHTITELHAPTVWTLLAVTRPRRTWGFWERRPKRPEHIWVWTKHDSYDSGHYNP